MTRLARVLLLHAQAMCSAMRRHVPLRLAPSVSAGSAGVLQRGARVAVAGLRGVWARVAGAAERWVLLRHPEHGELLRLEDT